MPIILQTEATECGLACLAMIASYHKKHTNLTELRGKFSIPMKGVSLNYLIAIAHEMNLGTRAVSLNLNDMEQLNLPCILHWNFNHFVVLQKVKAEGVTLYDPAHGVRTLSMNETSRSFTGVALELWPDKAFEKGKQKPAVKLSAMLGRMTGLYRSLTQIILLALALELFSLISPFFMQWTIDHVLISKDQGLLNTLVIGFALLLLIQQTVSGTRTWIMMHMSTLLNVQWKANTLGHLLRLPIEYFERRHLGDVVSRFGSVDTIQQSLTAAFMSTMLDGLMSVATLLMMFIYSPKLACIALGTMLIYFACRCVWHHPLKNATEQQVVHSARQNSHLLESIRGIRTLKLFQRENQRRSTWLNLFIEQINAGLRAQKLRLVHVQFNGFLFGAENLLTVWLGANMVMENQLTAGALLAFIAYKTQFSGRIGNLIDQLFDLNILKIQSERLGDIVLRAPEKAQTGSEVDRFDGTNLDIQISQLRFCYSKHEQAVITDLNLHIPAGKSIAIVGSSGCGKSTLLKLILGNLKPTEGSVCIGGVDINKLGHHGVRSLMSTVMQDDVLFAGSLSENISFFDEDTDMEWVKQCATLAAVDADIMAMPMGYNTLVGDMGTVLSGGQKQRIIIARALYKKPKILLLDEATSHLDLVCERQVNVAIQSLNITRIIIAHHPETIASADRTVLLVSGTVFSDTLNTPTEQNALTVQVKELEHPR